MNCKRTKAWGFELGRWRMNELAFEDRALGCLEEEKSEAEFRH